MAKTTRYGGRGDAGNEERRPQPRGRSSGSPVLPLAVLLGMIVGAVILARAIAGKDDQTEAAPPADTGPKPFAEYHEEPPTPGARGGGGSTLPRAPSGLEDSNPDWGRALVMASAADTLFEAAQKAKIADDPTTFSEKGIAAKEKYDEAFTLTAVWEEELLEKYGDRDPQVRAIMKTRTKWSDRMRMLHKTTGR